MKFQFNDTTSVVIKIMTTRDTAFGDATFCCSSALKDSVLSTYSYWNFWFYGLFYQAIFSSFISLKALNDELTVEWGTVNKPTVASATHSLAFTSKRWGWLQTFQYSWSIIRPVFESASSRTQVPSVRASLAGSVQLFQTYALKCQFNRYPANVEYRVSS
jgi:hypothetical protein